MVNVTELLESKFGTPLKPSTSDQATVGANLIDEVRVPGQGKDSVQKLVRKGNEGEVEMEIGEEGSNPNGIEDVLGGLSVDKSVEGGFTQGSREERVSEVGSFVQTGNEFNGINLVVDLSPRGGFGNNGNETEFCPGGNGKQIVVISEQVKNNEEGKGLEEHRGKDGKYEVTDLVWGKVRSHPWWPGQIFDPMAASEKAKKHCKKDGFLIAYFGDQTFAWNDLSQIKPFREHFSRMEKQSNTEAFCHALDCALDEVSRRIEFGLACLCLSEDVLGQIKSQVVVNAGISEESSRRDGGDRFSSVGSFVPAKLVQNVKALALDPFGGSDRLEFVKARAQLRAYNRWKGYYQLSTQNFLNGLLECTSDEPVSGEENVTEDAVAASESDEQLKSGKGKSTVRDSYSRKHKHIATDGVSSSKKEKRLSDLTSGGCLDLPKGKNKSVKAGRKTCSSLPGRKRKVVESLSDDSREESGTFDKKPLTPPPKKTYRVGESIRRISRKLSGSSSTLKNGDRSSQKPVGGSGGKSEWAPRAVPPSGSKRSRGVEVPAAYPPSDEILSQLYLAAIDPMKEKSSLTSLFCFFTDFRSYHVEKSNKNSAGKGSAKETVKFSPNSETTEVSGLKGIEDSYWTDRIIQSNPEEQVLFEPEVATVDFCPNSENKQGTAVASLESDEEKPADHLDDKCNEYSGTALILNFDKKASVPSVTNLNNIYSQHGPLKEVSTRNKRAKVVFERRSDAETAFSSAGKYSMFGPSLLTYSLDYSPTPQKSTTPARKQTKKKDATPAKAQQEQEPED